MFPAVELLELWFNLPTTPADGGSTLLPPSGRRLEGGTQTEVFQVLCSRKTGGPAGGGDSCGPRQEASLVVQVQAPRSSSVLVFRIFRNPDKGLRGRVQGGGPDLAQILILGIQNF